MSLDSVERVEDVKTRFVCTVVYDGCLLTGGELQGRSHQEV